MALKYSWWWGSNKKIKISRGFGKDLKVSHILMVYSSSKGNLPLHLKVLP